MEKERLYYVDWLRVLVILSLIPYHSALTFTGLGSTYIQMPLKDIRVLPFLCVTAPLDNFFMAMLFFLSGIASYYTLSRRTKRQYIGERARRLLIPMCIGFYTVCPLQEYFKALYNGFHGGFFSFLPQFFSNLDYLNYAHLWFLFYLFVFSALCAPLFWRWQKERSRLDKVSAFLCRGRNIYIPIAFIVLAETCLRPFFATRPYIIVNDWANDVLYVCMLLSGFVFAADENIQARLANMAKLSTVIALVCLPLLITFYYLWTACGASAPALTAAWAFTKGMYECFAIIALLNFAKKHWNRKSGAILYLGRASFSYYFWHYLPVSALTYVFISMDLSPYVKYLCVVALSFLFILAVYELVVRRVHKVEIHKNM